MGDRYEKRFIPVGVPMWRNGKTIKSTGFIANTRESDTGIIEVVYEGQTWTVSPVKLLTAERSFMDSIRDELREWNG